MAEDAGKELARDILNELTPIGMAEGLKRLDPRPMWQALQAYFGIGQPQQPPRRPGLDYEPDAPESVRRRQLENIQQQMNPMPVPRGLESGPVEPIPGLPRATQQDVLGPMLQQQHGLPIPPTAQDKLREQGPAYRGRPRKK